MILTTAGLLAIEKLRAGDKVLAADPESFEVGEKTILEAFERKVYKLVHLTINGEKIVTTDNHPFYVQGRGFIKAEGLFVGDKLISVDGKDLIVETHDIEQCEKPITVYNFNTKKSGPQLGDKWIKNNIGKIVDDPDDIIEGLATGDTVKELFRVNVSNDNGLVNVTTSVKSLK